MITVQEAFDLIFMNMPGAEREFLPIEECSGRVLGENIQCDIPMPPFDRSAMDGFALRGEAGSYSLLPEITAGADPAPMEKPGYAAPIMTGAPVPEGADRVVMVEATSVEGGVLRVLKMPPAGANICYRAEDISMGQTVLRSGLLLSPGEIGIAAMAGRAFLSVFTRPDVSVLTTGSEVVPPVHRPLPGQVRNANGPLMESFLLASGYDPAAVLHSADDPVSLRSAAEQALSLSNILITAGGVSMGTRDYIPSVMEELGFRFHFREVAQKPGKPLSFATRESDSKVIFGLPGNPVSVLVALETYVMPALRFSSGHDRYRKKVLSGKLLAPQRKKPGRQGFYRCRAGLIDGTWLLEVPETSGSGDLMSTSGTNAIAWLPPESTGLPAGADMDFSLMVWAGGEGFWEQ